MSSKHGTYLALFSLYILWSSTYFALAVAVKTFPPFSLSSIRYGIAGAGLVLLARSRGASWPSRDEWLRAIPVGALLFGIGNGFIAYSSATVPSGLIAVVVATMPLWMAFFGSFVGLKASRNEWIGIAVGLAGVAVLNIGGQISLTKWSHIAIVVSPMAWAIGSLIVRKRPQSSKPRTLPDTVLSSGIQMLSGAVWLGVGAVASGERVGRPSLAAWIAFAYLVVFGAMVGFLAYQYLLERVRPALATSYAYVNPALALILGAVAGGESIGLTLIAGSALILVAVVIVVWKPGMLPRRSISPAAS